MPINVIDSIHLFSDEFDSSSVFGVAKNKSEACLFLIDMAKLKPVSVGYTNSFECIRLFTNDTYSVSISGKSFVKVLKAQDGGWLVEDKLPKKQQNL